MTPKRMAPVRVLLARARQGLSDPGRVLVLVLLGSFIVRAAWLALPADGLIFDEAYYVNAARVILGWEVAPGAAYADAPAGLDPNVEHPSLGKALMALSMAAFGDNGMGWRLPSVIAAMIALVAVYLVVRRAGESRWLGVLVVAMLGFENLTLVHGRIGTLDMLVLAPILVGAWLALRGSWMAAGVLMGIGTLVKLTGVLGLAALLVWLGLELLGRWRRDRRIERAVLRSATVLVAGYAVVLVVGLWALDTRFTTYANPIDHLRHMVQYGTSLTKSGGVGGPCTGNDSAPWQWLVNDCEITYLRVDVETKVGETVVASRPSIDFRGAMNPVLIGSLSLALPATAWLAWRRRNRLACWALVWGAANYLPYVALALLSGRVSYLYYFLPVVPAVAIGVALLLLRTGLPRVALAGYAAAYALAFLAYFPFREIP
ncbi:MAG TPA: glycosyltransferase family 39 protein [Candidatus Sulfomarinibacteraceae bacterium]|nr:glycosyltransferase family 39 protein [Candidatus Sulfomarinibacteraceae bacterium]